MMLARVPANMMPRSGNSIVVALFIILCGLSGTAINDIRIIDNAAAEPDQENENLTFTVYDRPSDRPFEISPLDIVAIGACDYELSARIFNGEWHNTTVNVTAWIEEKILLCSQTVIIPPNHYQMVLLTTDFSGMNISDGTHKVSIRMNNSLSAISRRVFMVNPLPGLEITNISFPRDLHVNDAATLTMSVQNDNQSFRSFFVEVYDGRNLLNRTDVFDIPAGNSSAFSVVVRMSGPSNATHTFYLIAGGHLESRQQFVTRPTAATIGIMSFYADPREAAGTTGTQTRNTTLYLSLWNEGMGAGTVDVTIYYRYNILARQTVTVGGASWRNLTYPWNVSGQGPRKADARISGPDADRGNSTNSTVFNLNSIEVFFPRIGPIDLSIWANNFIGICVIAAAISLFLPLTVFLILYRKRR